MRTVVSRAAPTDTEEGIVIEVGMTSTSLLVSTATASHLERVDCLLYT